MQRVAIAAAVLGLAMTSACSETGMASWYGAESGRRTANGERFPTAERTCAHRTARFGTRLRVTLIATGRSIVCRINDRGPAAWTHRAIDLSPAAARGLGMRGVAKVRIEAIR